MKTILKFLFVGNKREFGDSDIIYEIIDLDRNVIATEEAFTTHLHYLLTGISPITRSIMNFKNNNLKYDIDHVEFLDQSHKDLVLEFVERFPVDDSDIKRLHTLLTNGLVLVN